MEDKTATLEQLYLTPFGVYIKLAMPQLHASSSIKLACLKAKKSRVLGGVCGLDRPSIPLLDHPLAKARARRSLFVLGNALKKEGIRFDHFDGDTNPQRSDELT